jgi:hypothetical protein
MVNDCGFARHSDFKRQFEDLVSIPDRNLAAICLTPADTMLINGALKAKGAHVCKLVSLILVTRRTAGGG